MTFCVFRVEGRESGFRRGAINTRHGPQKDMELRCPGDGAQGGGARWEQAAGPAHRWKLSTIFRCTRRSFLVRWSSMRASTRHSMKWLRYWGSPRLGSHSFPIHSWFMSP